MIGGARAARQSQVHASGTGLPSAAVGAEILTAQADLLAERVGRRLQEQRRDRGDRRVVHRRHARRAADAAAGQLARASWAGRSPTRTREKVRSSVSRQRRWRRTARSARRSCARWRAARASGSASTSRSRSAASPAPTVARRTSRSGRCGWRWRRAPASPRVKICEPGTREHVRTARGELQGPADDRRGNRARRWVKHHRPPR